MYCFNCGKKIEEDYNVCPYCGQQLKKTLDSQENKKPVEEEQTIKQSKKKPSDKRSALLALLYFVIILVGVFSVFFGGAYLYYEGIPSCQSSQTITAPTISSKSTLTGIDITIYAKADYEYVEIEVEYLDSNGNVLTTDEVTGYNYRKGNNYTLHSTPDILDTSISNLINMSHYRCKVKRYA